MINTKEFVDELRNMKYEFYTGVPCSYLKPFINRVIIDCRYVAACNEGQAVAIASGASLGGKKSVILMQNSGLGNAVSPLTSLNYPYRIAILGFVSLRGQIGIQDEPQHELMGRITEDMLRTMEIPFQYLSSNLDEAKQQLARADKYIENNHSFFFIVTKNTFTPEQEIIEKNTCCNQTLFKAGKIKEEELPTRNETLSIIKKATSDNTILIATTGKTGRELYELGDPLNNLYMVGSMGLASSFGLGLALVCPSKEIIVIDGDGAALMHMGGLASNGHYNPDNLLHILLDNNSYDSTGGQNTVSETVNFVDIAAACRYRNSIYSHNLKELEENILKWRLKRQLTFIYLKICKGSKEGLGRPKIKPYEVKERLKVFING